MNKMKKIALVKNAVPEIRNSVSFHLISNNLTNE